TTRPWPSGNAGVGVGTKRHSATVGKRRGAARTALTLPWSRGRYARVGTGSYARVATGPDARVLNGSYARAGDSRTGVLRRRRRCPIAPGRAYRTHRSPRRRVGRSGEGLHSRAALRPPARGRQGRGRGDTRRTAGGGHVLPERLRRLRAGRDGPAAGSTTGGHPVRPFGRGTLRRARGGR